MIAEHVEAAQAELRITTKAQINAKTAITWGARAVAAYTFYAETGDPGWRDHAIEYGHEAIEHAADATPGLLEEVRAELRTLTKGIVG